MESVQLISENVDSVQRIFETMNSVHLLGEYVNSATGLPLDPPLLWVKWGPGDGCRPPLYGTRGGRTKHERAMETRRTDKWDIPGGEVGGV